MPDRVLSYQEREEMQPQMMVDFGKNAVDPKTFGEKQVALIRRAASYREVERVFVNPTIKKALCLAAGKDRKWLAKVRPIWGHDYHFHIRMGCTNGGCEGQKSVDSDEGCGKELDNWLKMVAKSGPSPKPGEKVVGASDLRKVTMDQLPAACRTVLSAGQPTTVAGEAKTPEASAAATKPAEPAKAAEASAPAQKPAEPAAAAASATK
jgi:penicillin-insensitive murein endopeptidase